MEAPRNPGRPTGSRCRLTRLLDAAGAHRPGAFAMPVRVRAPWSCPGRRSPQPWRRRRPQLVSEPCAQTTAALARQALAVGQSLGTRRTVNSSISVRERLAATRPVRAGKSAPPSRGTRPPFPGTECSTTHRQPSKARSDGPPLAGLAHRVEQRVVDARSTEHWLVHPRGARPRRNGNQPEAKRAAGFTLRTTVRA